MLYEEGSIETVRTVMLDAAICKTVKAVVEGNYSLYSAIPIRFILQPSAKNFKAIVLKTATFNCSAERHND